MSERYTRKDVENMVQNIVQAGITRGHFPVNAVAEVRPGSGGAIRYQWGIKLFRNGEHFPSFLDSLTYGQTAREAWNTLQTAYRVMTELPAQPHGKAAQPYN